MHQGPVRVPARAGGPLTVGGILLAGGESRRMGTDKALLDWHGAPLGRHGAMTLREAVRPGPVVFVGAVGRHLPAVDGVRVVEDAVAGQGPLQGLRDGLVALAGSVDVAFVSTVDAPFLAPAFVRALVEALGGADAAVPQAHERRHPLTAVYRVSVLPVVEAMLAGGTRRVLDFIDRLEVRYVGEAELRAADPALRSLVNVNTQAEYQEALRMPAVPAAEGRP